MPPTATRSATRFGQSATLGDPADPLRTVAVLISDLVAQGRVITALRQEGLSVRIVAMKDFTMRGLGGPPVAALVYDLAPWSDAAIAFLRRLRGFPTALPDLPVLVYAPQRPEVAQLLVQAGRLSMVWAELQFERADEVRRLRQGISRVLAVAPAAVVFRLLMVHLPEELPADMVQFCRRACGQLAAGRGDALTVSRLASDSGVERRTVERRWRERQITPKELLDWIVVVFAAYVRESHGLDITAADELLGMDSKRLQRSRFRLKSLWKPTGTLDEVLMHLARRAARIRIPRARPIHDLRTTIPHYEAVEG